MRIAILADPLDNQNAGVHIYTRHMVRALLDANDGNEYILVRERRDDQYPGAEQIVVPNVHLPIGFASFRLFFWIPFILRRKRIDAVIEPAHFGPFNLPRRIKRVTVIHDLTPIMFPHLHRWHSQLLQKLFLRRILRKADLIVANSNNTAADIERIYPVIKGKVSRIYLGKDDVYVPTGADSMILEKIWDNGPLLLVCWNHRTSKRSTDLIGGLYEI